MHQTANRQAPQSTALDDVDAHRVKSRRLNRQVDDRRGLRGELEEDVEDALIDFLMRDRGESSGALSCSLYPVTSKERKTNAQSARQAGRCRPRDRR